MTSTTPVISIIVPNRNYAKYLPSALDSIKYQTFTDWECIVIDDASVDDSVKIIKKYVRADKRFKLIQSDEHIGIGAARNRGLDMARGEYIAFLDSDDSFVQNTLELLLQLIRQTNADMAGGRAQNVDYTFEFIPQKFPVMMLSDFYSSRTPTELMVSPKNHNWVWIWRRLYRRSFIGDIRFHEQFKTLGEDICFMLDLCARDCLLVECNNPIVYHRTHIDSVTSDKPTAAAFDWFPDYFRYLRDNILTKYNSDFLRLFYDQAIRYMLFETIVKPHKMSLFHAEARRALIDSCKLIPRRYLTFKFKVLCWFMSCLK